MVIMRARGTGRGPWPRLPVETLRHAMMHTGITSSGSLAVLEAAAVAGSEPDKTVT